MVSISWWGLPSRLTALPGPGLTTPHPASGTLPAPAAVGVLEGLSPQFFWWTFTPEIPLVVDPGTTMPL
ncbi:hypothetical protein DSO57_1029453, partial [Entomophthora muscae]